MEDEFIAREKKVLSLIEEEISEGEEMAEAVRHIAGKMLVREKGYDASDIRGNVRFAVTLGAETVQSSVDFLVTLNKSNAMVIKCAAGSLASRERQAVAAARVLGALPVPVAVVMDPMSAVVLDASTGKVLGEGFDAIPKKPELEAMLSGRELKPIPADKLEREKRVLLAFDAIRCCIPKGADGGVQIGDPGQCGDLKR